MGMRKKINAINAILRKKAKVKRDQAKIKRANTPATPGQTLHEEMHGRRSA